MDRPALEKERAALQAILDDYEIHGFKQFGVGDRGDLDRETTNKRRASLKRRIAALDEKIAKADDA